MSYKKLADEAIEYLNQSMKNHVDSRCATTEEVYMAAMAVRIQELEKWAVDVRDELLFPLAQGEGPYSWAAEGFGASTVDLLSP